MRPPEEHTDTDFRAMEAWVKLYKDKTPGEKLALVFGASQWVLQLYEMGVRRSFPGASDREVLLRVAARHLPRELMIKAYGWDPESNGKPS